ncbi:S-methyl-5-thioribose kinase [Pseudoalteromonas luteoviolacea]|uniref:Methylthioribose kinase n=1 Tax=Pseudoalteromonas luteoviolacea TaxID=43657 RepID=A0A1C0TJQ9_9GAMM|nr:S-methyl-5-thioribose kinase [Pseudoalteromonas luteoviolacea]OCQ18803.1 S-methyl-5-thioribose kinase [Pseudoalteromonas luteoviolacea]
MSKYAAFNNETALDYVKSLGLFFSENAELTCYEFGDGNLNLVFRVADTNNNSVILKQALPYARCVGESWPLTLDRARIEAHVLQRHGNVCPAHTAKVLHHDSNKAATILEDLGAMAILRAELIAGRTFENLGRDVAQYLATTGFYHSDFYLSPQEKKSQIHNFTNPELCAITEELFFDDPYRECERNDYPAELTEQVNQLRQNTTLLCIVARLKAKFFSSPQTLLHGDVHTGSIFVSDGNTKLIDPEFGFFGPIGFDLGSFIGNLLLNYCAQNGRIKEIPKRRDVHSYLLNTISVCLQQFEQQWHALAQQHTRDLALQAPGYLDLFLQEVLQDAMGYCGTELIRRTIGLAHVADIAEIEDDAQRLVAQKQALQLGEQLLLNAKACRSIDDFYQLIISFVH